MIKELIGHFKASLIITILVAAIVLVFMGADAFVAVVILIAIELTFSFDNSIINAKLVKQLSKRWQTIFLTLGLLIAVLGMRVIFPIVLIVVTAHIGFIETVKLAFEQPHLYAEKLELAHPAIAAFGGMFLLVLALNFFMLDKSRPLWLKSIERPLKLIDRQWVVIALSVLILLVVALVPGNKHPSVTLEAGIAAIIVFFVIHFVTEFSSRAFGRKEGKASQLPLTGIAAFTVFLHLEILDASFSLDGVLGALAVTNNIILIAAGLGVGALWVRSLTVYIVKKGTLEEFVYVEHGAHYAIFVLAVSLLVSEVVEVPSVIIGVLGLGVIVASVIASHRKRLSSYWPAADRN